MNAEDPTAALVMGALRRAAAAYPHALVAAREGGAFRKDLREIRSGEVSWSGRVVVPVDHVINVVARRDIVRIERSRFDGQKVLWGTLIGAAVGAVTCAAIFGRGTGPDTMAAFGALFCGAIGSGIGTGAGSIAGARGKIEVVYDVNALP